MGMVADSRTPRPCTVHGRSFTTALALILLFTAANVVAQDRVVLFGHRAWPYDPFEIREFDISDGGRRWALTRTVTLPANHAGFPVLLADRSRLLWLAFSSGSTTVLVQYEFATARASVVNVGSFDGHAVLAADPSALRVVIVEPTRVTFLDERLQPYSVALDGLMTSRPSDVAVADGYVVVQRAVGRGAEAVVINALTAEVVRTIPLGGGGHIRVTRDAQRLYILSGAHVELRSLTTGQVLARGIDDGVGVITLFELDESRGLVIHDGADANNRKRIVAMDATTLARVGELGFGLFDGRSAFRLQQTRHEDAILVSSLQFPSTGFDFCAAQSPRIDVLDGNTFTLVAQIDLQRRCAVVIAVPPR